jgi:hypothetical protein
MENHGKELRRTVQMLSAKPHHGDILLKGLDLQPALDVFKTCIHANKHTRSEIKHKR